MNWKRFLKNLSVLVKSLAEEESISIVPQIIPIHPIPPKRKPSITKREVKDLIAKSIKKIRVKKKETNEKTEIKWPEGELTFEELCQANVNFSKEEIRKAIGKKMEQHRKVLT